MSQEKQEHRWVKLKGFKWPVCARCDLVLLKNKATEKALKSGCVGAYIRVVAPKSQAQKDAEKGGK